MYQFLYCIRSADMSCNQDNIAGSDVELPVDEAVASVLNECGTLVHCQSQQSVRSNHSKTSNQCSNYFYTVKEKIKIVRKAVEACKWADETDGTTANLSGETKVLLIVIMLWTKLQVIVLWENMISKRVVWLESTINLWTALPVLIARQFHKMNAFQKSSANTSMMKASHNSMNKYITA
jgi:hypothetical protein